MATTPTLKRTDFTEFSLLQIADCDATPQKDVMEGPCRVLAAIVDATAAGVVADVVLKFYDSTNPTVGTTAPDTWVLVTDGQKASVMFDPPNGIPFETALSIACVSYVGVADGPGTGGTISPAGDVAVTLFCLKGAA